MITVVMMMKQQQLLRYTSAAQKRILQAGTGLLFTCVTAAGQLCIAGACQ
jgi:hypothetical protein